ncbi:MAG: hypothetical protein QN122_12395 [Armatimonadota bacterium]|nr:hypothetical protein [Armatimonadota bacterium]
MGLRAVISVELVSLPAVLREDELDCAAAERELRPMLDRIGQAVEGQATGWRVDVVHLDSVQEEASS